MKSKIVEISYSMSITKQIREYEPMNVHFSMKAEVPENDWKMCLKEIRDKVRDVIKNEGKVMNAYQAMVKKPFGTSAVKEMDDAEKDFYNSLDKIQ